MSVAGDVRRRPLSAARSWFDEQWISRDVLRPMIFAVRNVIGPVLEREIAASSSYGRMAIEVTCVLLFAFDGITDSAPIRVHRGYNLG